MMISPWRILSGIYPNPVHSSLVVTGVKPGARYELSDLTGRFIIREMMTDNHIDASKLKDEIYIITIEDEEGRSIHKIVKQ